MFKLKSKIPLLLAFLFIQGCMGHQNKKDTKMEHFHLIVLDPGHFHASLLQKYMYNRIDSTVEVYAPRGPGLKFYLKLIKGYNNRSSNPTGWKERVYAGPDYLQKMLLRKPEKKDIVVIAGNNKKKEEYIEKCLKAKINVLADKPMAITSSGFEQLKKDFKIAKEKNVLLYDIMTERNAIHYILQKELAHSPSIFGQINQGTAEEPAVIFKSSHVFYKEVSGNPVLRPAWFLDTAQQGEGLVDITTHLVDLIQWECFPKEVLNYKQDVKMLSAKHWPTILTPLQFKKVTQRQPYPAFLKKDEKDSLLYVYSNGEMNYTIRGIHARVAVNWEFQAKEGSGDIFFSTLKGSKANLTIRQGKAQDFIPILYIEPTNVADQSGWVKSLRKWENKIQSKHPGISLKENHDGVWEVVIPNKLETGEEQRFAGVVKQYLNYLKKGDMPKWEISFMLSKYFTTTEARKMANNP